MAITSNNKTQQGKEARHETAGLQKQIIFLLTFHLILKFWAGPWFRRTHYGERTVLMSYIKTKWGAMGLFSRTSPFSTTSWHLGTGIWKMQWIREAWNLFFFFLMETSSGLTLHLKAWLGPWSTIWLPGLHMVVTVTYVHTA